MIRVQYTEAADRYILGSLFFSLVYIVYAMYVVLDTFTQPSEQFSLPWNVSIFTTAEMFFGHLWFVLATLCRSLIVGGSCFVFNPYQDIVQMILK